ncbi:hypothetical protein [Methylobacterium crusticola]|nr:hypothetical protein [Methylobacterium crusticola]
MAVRRLSGLSGGCGTMILTSTALAGAALLLAGNIALVLALGR